MSTTITRRLIGLESGRCIIGLESGRYIMDLRELVAELSDLPPHAYIEDARIAGSKIAISVRIPSETKHVEARRGMPAYCMACTGARALHRMDGAS